MNKEEILEELKLITSNLDKKIWLQEAFQLVIETLNDQQVKDEFWKIFCETRNMR